MTQALADMRRDYTRDGLAEAQAPAEPFALFHQWFADAVKTEQPPVEANAMTLATVDDDGRPHCRVLLLKGLDAQGFTFFTNYTSAKGQQLAARPYAAMTFSGQRWSVRCVSRARWSRLRQRNPTLTIRCAHWAAGSARGRHRKVRSLQTVRR